MQELKEALTYATVNGSVGFALYSGSAIYFGQDLYPAFTSALGIALMVFGSYMIREQDEISIELDEILPPKKHGKQVNRFKNRVRPFTPTCVRRKGLFRFI